MESASLIRVTDLTVSYGGVTAVDGVSFSAGVGVCALLGPNGAGKSTILAAMLGLKSYRGQIDVRTSTHDSTKQPRERMGYLPQRFDLAANLRVGETVAYAAWCSGARRKACTDLADQALTKVGLEHKPSHRTSSLSGGERQRLAIACAISHSPRVLLLDEPAVGLDPSQRTLLRQYLMGIAETTCVIMATHLLDDVQLASDTILVVNGGSLVFQGTKEDLLQHGSSQRPEHESAIESAYRTLTGSINDK